MRRMQLSVFGLSRSLWTRLGITAWLCLAGVAALAQVGPPPNDNFANALVLTGSFGSVTNDNTFATAEPFEPSHAGFVPSSTMWYKWTAPADGEVSLDTIGSTVVVDNGLTYTTNFLDTVVAVYTGNELRLLTQVAANDDYFPMSRYPRLVDSSLNYTQVRRFGFGTNTFTDYFVSEIMSYPLPFNGPSGLRFNATSGTTYYFAVDTKLPSVSYLLPFDFGGPVALNWAYRPSGVFRLATEDVGIVSDFSGGGGGGFFSTYEV